MSEPVGVHRVEKKRLNPWWVVHELVHWSICATVIALGVSVTFLGGRGLAAAVGGAHPNVVPTSDVVCLALCASGILMGGAWALIELQIIFTPWLDRLSDLGRDKHVDKE